MCTDTRPGQIPRIPPPAIAARLWIAASPGDEVTEATTHKGGKWKEQGAMTTTPLRIGRFTTTPDNAVWDITWDCAGEWVEELPLRAGKWRHPPHPEITAPERMEEDRMTAHARGCLGEWVEVLPLRAGE